jgi:hypothetical protein
MRFRWEKLANTKSEAYLVILRSAMLNALLLQHIIAVVPKVNTKNHVISDKDPSSIRNQRGKAENLQWK